MGRRVSRFPPYGVRLYRWHPLYGQVARVNRGVPHSNDELLVGELLDGTKGDTTGWSDAAVRLRHRQPYRLRRSIPTTSAFVRDEVRRRWGRRESSPLPASIVYAPEGPAQGRPHWNITGRGCSIGCGHGGSQHGFRMSSWTAIFRAGGQRSERSVKL